MKNELEGLLQGVLKRSVAIDETKAIREVPGFDSLKLIHFIVAVEKAFAVKFTTGEILSFMTWGDLLQCLQRRLHE